MADFNNDGEKLVEQRNESSVLFSLDSLSSMGDGSDDVEGSFGNAGDKSGLIDLNTLAAMGNEGSAQFSSSDDEFTGNAPVFAKVKSKSEARKTYIIIAIVAVVVIGLAVAGFLGIRKYQEAAAAAAQKEADLEAQIKKEQADRQAEINERENKIRELENQMKKSRELDENTKKQLAAQIEAEKAAAEKAKQEQQNIADNIKKTPQKSNSNTNSGSGDKQTPPPPKKGAGPDSNAVKAALQASNTKAGKCGKGGNLKVSMTLNPNGKASNIKAISGTFQGTPTEKCIITVVSNSTFPTFSGAAINASWNYKL